MTLGKNRRNLNSMPRLGFGRSRSRINLTRAETARAKFGVIPILTDEMKIKWRAEKITQLKLQNQRPDEADRFLKKAKGLTESPTSMKMMNTFLLKNNNSSFDNYAIQMKKKRFGNIAGSSFKRSKDEISNGDPMSISGAPDFEDSSTLKIN